MLALQKHKINRWMTVVPVTEKGKSEAINHRTDNILVKSADVVTSIKQSPVLRGHLFLVLS
jgi:hypothetical protein